MARDYQPDAGDVARPANRNGSDPVQSEIDVVRMRLSGGHREIWFCEVIAHIDGTLYGTYEKTMRELEAKHWICVS